MHRLAWSMVLLTIFAPGQRAGAGDKGGMFMSADLSGWEGLMEYWSYKDGVLTGSAPKGLKFNTFLCSKTKHGDFELHFKVKLTGANPNSGVQIRSKIRDNPKDKANFAVEGPQCDMGQVYWGSLYGEHFGGMMKAAPKELVEKVLKKNDFNDYYIKCVGKHVTIKLNGEVTVDGEFPRTPDDGIIAFQLHSGGPMEVVFKDIKFKAIPSKKASSRVESPESRAEGRTPASSLVALQDKKEEPKKYKLLPEEVEMIELINKFRAKEKLPPLKASPILCEVSRNHSKDMAKEMKLAHELYGKNPSDRAKAAGYTGPVAENVAGGSAATPQFYLDIWAKSKPHTANILGEKWTEIGIGFARTKDGRGDFYTAMFSPGK